MLAHHPSTSTPSTTARFLAVALAIGMTAGCSPGDDAPASPSLPQAQAAATDLQSPADETVQARLPDGFPTQFPLPADLVIAHGSFTPSDAMTQGGFLVRGHSATGLLELATFFAEGLPDAGFDLQQAASIQEGANSALLYFNGDGFRDCSVQLGTTDDGTDVTISLPLDD